MVPSIVYFWTLPLLVMIDISGFLLASHVAWPSRPGPATCVRADSDVRARAGQVRACGVRRRASLGHGGPGRVGELARRPLLRLLQEGCKASTRTVTADIEAA
jgi:hypothetical protein